MFAFFVLQCLTRKCPVTKWLMEINASYFVIFGYIREGMTEKESRFLNTVIILLADCQENFLEESVSRDAKNAKMLKNFFCSFCLLSESNPSRATYFVQKRSHLPFCVFRDVSCRNNCIRRFQTGSDFRKTSFQYYNDFDKRCTIITLSNHANLNIDSV